MQFNTILKQLKLKGNIAYEYNPFKNLRLRPTYKKNSENQYELSENGATHALEEGGDYVYKGTLSDFSTDLLNFDLEHPVDIECQHSYDGSVNLILSDGLNPVRLVNSRYTVRQNNTYEIVDRTGNADTNLYDEDLFDIDTSLYKKINTIPQLEFEGIALGGNLPVGNYNFYFKYVDADGNESDFIAESGNVVCHIGNVNDPKSIRSGLENENSGKIVKFILKNLDTAYEYIKVYYSRLTSASHNEPVTEYKKIVKTFKNNPSYCKIHITGFEETLPSSLEEINCQYFLASSAKSIALCKNRLFLANLSKPTIDYQDFCDISLRMLPYYSKTLMTELDQNYRYMGDYGYYNVQNIYNKVGYWNEEIYRLGVVYILADNSLSPVFNIRGADGIPKLENLNNFYSEHDFKDSEDNRVYINYNSETNIIQNNKTTLENNKGVIRINDSDSNLTDIYNIGVAINSEIKNYLKNVLHIKGLFFVRQKRLANLLTQAIVLGNDLQSGIPLFKNGNDYEFESFVDSHSQLNTAYESRVVSINADLVANEIALCPDYAIRQELYSNLFVDSDFVIKPLGKYTISQDQLNPRHYYTSDFAKGEKAYETRPVIGVPENTKVKRTKTSVFCTKAGTAESYDFAKIGIDFDLDYGDSSTITRQIARGIFSSFIGISTYRGDYGDLVNVYIPDYSESKMRDYFSTRYEDQTPYYAISDRLDITKLSDNTPLFRGDCYICKYTLRIHRNFLDLSAPTNDIIVDMHSWYNNYRPDTDKEKLADINVGDLNAIPIGTWLTCTVRSNVNLCMRNNDESNISETLTMGNCKSFYPLSEMSVDGNYKLADSSVINTGISSQTSLKANFIQPEVPYLKNCFLTRIAYSDIAITDAFKNGYRNFLEGAYKDYPITYGGIMKILDVKGSLLVIFEHGIGIASVNERVMSGSGSGGNIFINSDKVLPETLNMIATDYGSLWPNSVLQTPHGIYGVDTVAKKIWRYAGNQIELLSEDKVQKFLNDNITLSEKEMTPIIGIRNVKTHYNAFKKDVMFTFYDCKEGYEEHAWNLCYNEYSGKFVTFYSWIPSFSANIDNIFFSFDRDTSKKLAKLDTTIQEGIVIDTPVLDNPTLRNTRNNNTSNINLLDAGYSNEPVEYSLNNGVLTIEKGDVKKTNMPWASLKNSIKVIEIKNNVTSIEDSSFANYTSLTNVIINEGSKLSNIENKVFYGCLNLTTINIPQSVVSIGDLVFYNCLNLAAINIPQNVTNIGNNTFGNCSRLNIITFLSKTITFGNEVFKNCNYEIIDFTNITEIPTFGTNVFKIDNDIKAHIIYIPHELNSLWSEYWKNRLDKPLNVLLITSYQSNISLKAELPDKYKIFWEIEPTLFKTNELFSFSVFQKTLQKTHISHKKDGNSWIPKHEHSIKLYMRDKNKLNTLLEKHKAIPLNIKATVLELSPTDLINDTNGITWKIFEKLLYFTISDFIKLAKTKPSPDGSELISKTKEELDEDAKKVLTTAFWKHGYGGIINSQGKLKPCNWYGKQHPFEFEYVVNVSPDQLKIFDGMLILSNNVAPESFHYEIVGDSYDFSKDKLNMYVRLELTKHLYQLNGSDIVYNSNYKDLLGRVEQRPIYNYDKSNTQLYEISENRYQSGYFRSESVYKDKSTLFPTYYTRVDTFDEIYDDYVRATDPNNSRNYSQLSGGEVKYDPVLDQFSIVNHVQAIDMKNPIYGRLRGNMLYLNDKWHVQINPLNFVLKNETTWDSYLVTADTRYNKIPINVRYSSLIHDIQSINPDLTPGNYNIIDTSDWGKRKEVILQDKYMKVKIRYSGDKLALVTGVRTVFKI